MARTTKTQAAGKRAAGSTAKQTEEAVQSTPAPKAAEPPQPALSPQPIPPSPAGRGEALGMVETRGLVAAINAADAMLKTADVSLTGTQRTGSGLVAVLVRGGVSAVTAAAEAGSAAASAFGQVVAVRVIASPHVEVEEILQ